MIRIGDFSALTHVSVRTLRFYDETGLLRPVHTESGSGYRFYSASQLPRLHRILALKDLGFSLEQIAAILDGGVSAGELRGMLILRKTEQQDKVRQEHERLTRLETRLRLIEKENEMTPDVILKDVPRQWIASVRSTIPTYSSIGPLYGEIFQALGPKAMNGVAVAIWHDREHKDSDVDAEAGVFLQGPAAASGRVQVYELPPARVASMIHAGAYNRLYEAHGALVKWLEANGLRLAGPARELYLKLSQPVRQDDESYVTELQHPVEPNGSDPSGH